MVFSDWFTNIPYSMHYRSMCDMWHAGFTDGNAEEWGCTHQAMAGIFQTTLDLQTPYSWETGRCSWIPQVSFTFVNYCLDLEGNLNKTVVNMLNECFLNKIKFIHFRYLVEAMEKCYLQRFMNSDKLDQYSKETTPMNQILGGYLRSTVRCLACHHLSTTYQHFQVPLKSVLFNPAQIQLSATSL